MSDCNSIVFVIRDLGVGGAERVFVRLANYCASRKIETHLVCLTGSGPLAETLSEEVSLHVLNKPSIRKSAFAFRKLISKLRPKLVISTLPQVNLLAILALITLRKRPRIIIREANDPASEFPFKTRFRKPIMWLMGIIYSRADRVLAVSQGVKESLSLNLGLDLSKVIALRNASLDDSIFERSNEALPAGSLNLINSFTHRISCVARFVEQKDHATLINAFSTIAVPTDSVLILIGYGPGENSIRKLVSDYGIADRVLFITDESNPYRWLKASSLSVLSSRWEGSPNVLVESLALGIPVVATDCPSGPREILENGRWGKLVPIRNPAALATALREALHEPSAGEALQQHALEFHIDNVGARFLDEVACG